MKNEKLYTASRHWHIGISANWHIIISAYLLISSLAFVSCRSNKDLHKISEVDSEIQGSASTHSKDSTATTTSRRDSTANITSEKQYIRTTWYRPDGTIRKIQEEGRATERTELAVHDTGSSSVSVNENKTDSTAVTKTQTKEIVHENTSIDSRLIQGSEWAWFAGVFALVVAIFGYIEYKKVKNEK